MPIPFPPVTGNPWAASPPYATSAPVDPAGHFSAKYAWLQTPAPTQAYYWDPRALTQRAATAISVNTATKTLSLTAEGSAMTFDLSGDGTGRIPVGIILP